MFPPSDSYWRLFIVLINQTNTYFNLYCSRGSASWGHQLKVTRSRSPAEGHQLKVTRSFKNRKPSQTNNISPAAGKMCLYVWDSPEHLQQHHDLWPGPPQGPGLRLGSVWKIRHVPCRRKRPAWIQTAFWSRLTTLLSSAADQQRFGPERKFWTGGSIRASLSFQQMWSAGRKTRRHQQTSSEVLLIRSTREADLLKLTQ